MNNLTHKIFLVLLFVATSVSVWAKGNETPTSKKTTSVAIPPAAPAVAYLGVDRCGYQAAGDARMSAILQAKGCGNGFIQWYDSNGANLGRNLPSSDLKYLDVTNDMVVSATCTEFGEESPRSQSLFIRYLAAPSAQPFIAQDKATVCDGETITLKSSVTDSKYIYSWERGISQTTYGYLIDESTKGQGSPELKVTKSGYYFLSVTSPDCPSVRVYAQGQVYAEFFSVPKPKVTASDSTFCEDKSISLKSDSTQFVTKYEWYVNGTKQDSLGSKSFIKFFNKTAKIQALAIGTRLSCKSPLSDVVSVRALRVPAKPVITPSKTGAAICQGDTLSLTSSLGFKYKWSNGAITPSIRNISAVGKYAVQVIDTSGCVSKPSDTTTITVFKLPAKPVISADGPIAFCSGGSVNLTSTPNTTYIWSTKATTRAINVNTSGDFTVAVRDVNNCLSPTSDIVKVTVYALPAKPTITASGPLSFCADQSVVLTSSDLINGEKTRYRWSTTDSTKSLTVKTSATFTVRVLDPRNCLSPASDPISTIALPLPPAPTVTADGPLVFCARSNADYTKPNSVNLIATSQNVVTWSTGLVAKTLTLTAIGADGKFIDISREYTATAKDATTGCISSKSVPLVIVVKNNPDVSASSIDKDGTFTLKAVNFPDGTDYEWKYGTEVLKFTEGVIKANRYGDYTARRKTVFTVPAPTNTLACFSDFVKPFNFKEDPDFKGLSIYPNPSNGLLTIETLADYENPEIIIYDLLGRLIYTGTVPSIKGKLIVDLRNQPEGEYMLRFKASGFDLAKRIIINR
ncbi:putative secreted protein (Por secretion system target) [Arcicella aurantiaca]|uniref:Putative secreted protein (Por secretion system target) n=1 Tax=Arcicella aurantiaca TaxID=591202 RepID=A0A316EDN4_9BACT|nr:T9SS type A sorting domain-containing protein [Arcicella aurantiaca]PWK27766.1 putative secreted protein (Por secretion system target) [Arcicella aurantiaca]